VAKRGSGRRRAARGISRAISRAIAMLAFLPLASRIPLYARLIWALVLDDRIPVQRKAILGGALGYLFLARDVVPDEVPILGGLDDIVVVALAVDLFLEGVPTLVLAEKLEELHIDRTAYEDDIASIRRVMPMPVRRLIRRLPEAFRILADTIGRSDLGPRLRSWIRGETPGSRSPREGSIA
jgi:uncharacterized membrane protein YkvA (DUF1232 family)